MGDLYCKPCAICGENNPASFKIWFDGYLKIYRCLTCGFVSQFPGPGRFTIVTEYQDRYSLDFVDKGKEFMYPHRRRAFQDMVDRLTAIKPGGSILDVGCGDGHFLYLCSKKSFDCHGVDDSNHLSAYASSKSGAKITRGQYSKEMFLRSSFDIISFIQVVEHIPTPITVLETARYHLRPGGILLIEVPSIHSPHFLVYALTGMKQFVTSAHEGVIDAHCGYYTPKTLVALTKKCKFQQVSLVTGRWQHKYHGLFRLAGKAIDPLLNMTKIGGILYIGKKTD